MGRSDKKSRITKELRTSSFSLGHHQGSWGRKATELKGSQYSDHQGFFVTQNQVTTTTTWKKKNPKNFSRATKYSFHHMCTEDCQKLSNKDKGTKFNEVIFLKQLAVSKCFFPYGNTMRAATLCLVFVRNSAIDKDYSMVWWNRNKQQRTEKKQKRRFSSSIPEPSFCPNCTVSRFF